MPSDPAVNAVSVVIVNWNSGSMLARSVNALEAGIDIVVVDNASSDDSVHQLESNSGPQRVRVVRLGHNTGFAGGVNRGFRETETPFTLILNPDVRAMPGAVEALVNLLEREPRAGAVGGFVNARYAPRRFPSVLRLMLENLGLRRPLGEELVPAGPVRVEQPAAAALMVRREAFDEVGGFDEGFFPAWYEDVDFARRLENRGWERWFEPRAEFEHDGGYSAASLGTERFFEAYYTNQLRYARMRLSPRAVPLLKGALSAGTIARMAARPRLATGYWRGLKRVLRA